MKREFTNPAQNELANGNLVIKNPGRPFDVTEEEAKVLDGLTTVMDGVTVPAFQEPQPEAPKPAKKAVKDEEK